MKVTEESFSLSKEEKGAEEARYDKYTNFQAKGLLPDRTPESFIQTKQVKKLICSITCPFLYYFFYLYSIFPNPTFIPDNSFCTSPKRRE